MESEGIFLGIATICDFLDSSPRSRNFIEGENILRSKHLILCEASKKTELEIHLYALCLQTSALSSPPHTIEGKVTVSKKKDVGITDMVCSCKAGNSKRCKHIAATLLYCTRNDVSKLDILSTTDKKCLWKERKEVALSGYQPTPLLETECVNKPDIPMVTLSEEMKKFCLSKLLESVPTYALAKHRQGRLVINQEDTGVAEEVSLNTEKSYQEERRIFNNLIIGSDNNEWMKWTYNLEIRAPHECCQKVFDSKVACNDPVEICIKTYKDKMQWKRERQYRITGSRCYSIYTYKKEDWSKKATHYFWPKEYKNANMLYGLKYEEAARTAYSRNNLGSTIIQTGLIVDKSNPWLAYSPDGIVLKTGQPTKLLEIKCIINGKDETVKEAIKSCKFILIETDEEGNVTYKLKNKHSYYGQVQLGMALLNLNKTDFIVYASFDNSFLTIPVELDGEFLQQLLHKLKFNYFLKMLHYICVHENHQ